MSFLCEYNIKTYNVWDKYSNKAVQNTVPSRLRKKRPNSKVSQQKFNGAIKSYYTYDQSHLRKNINTQQEGENKKATSTTAATTTVTTTTTTTAELTTFFSIIETEPDFEYGTSQETETKIDNLSPATLSIVKVIQTIFTLAFQ